MTIDSPSGRLSLIEPMSLASMASGADGIMIEVHCKPNEAICDKDQAMAPDIFTRLMKKLRVLETCMRGLNGDNRELLAEMVA